MIRDPPIPPAAIAPRSLSHPSPNPPPIHGITNTSLCIRIMIRELELSIEAALTAHLARSFLLDGIYRQPPFVEGDALHVSYFYGAYASAASACIFRYVSRSVLVFFYLHRTFLNQLGNAN